MAIEYAKPYLDVPQQVDLLISRGMTITDRLRAEDYLRRIGYYRLSAYWYPFRNSILTPDARGKPQRVIYDDFKPGTDFGVTLALYVFDKKLRLLLLDALERIEIALRTDAALLLGWKDPWAHRDPGCLHGNFARKVPQKTGLTAHAAWLRKLDKIAARSKDEFAQHFRQKYRNSKLPIWMAVELFDFGMLSRLIDGMIVADKDVLAWKYGLPRRELLTSWLRTLNFVRNVCAHHGRLWNRPLDDEPKPPLLGELPELDHIARNRLAQQRLYAAMAILRFMLRIINPSTSWAERLKAHLATFSDNPNLSFDGMGCPAEWQKEPLWQ